MKKTIISRFISLPKSFGKHNKHGGVALMLASLVCADVAYAQESLALEEIVVTARKKAESLQSVPITVSAFTEQGLENRGIDNSADIGNFVSNVQFDTSSSFAGTSTFQAFIRGIGQTDFAINTDPGVGVYVDGVYYARAAGAVLELLDVERVEVLKGPQGTLFGRNSIGGAVNVITRSPSSESSLKVQATVGENNRADLSFVASGSLSDNLYGSFAASTSNRDGFQKRIPFPGANTGNGGPRLDQTLVTGPNVSNDDELGAIASDTVRGKLLWEFNDNAQVTLAADYTDSDTTASALTLLDAEFAPEAMPLSGLFNACVAGAPIPPCFTSPFIAQETLPFDNRFLTGDIDTTFANGANFSRSEDLGFSATIDWQVNNNLELKSITAYREIDQAFGVDVDSTPVIFNQTTFTIDQDQFSQEFQFTGDVGKLSYTAGLYYFTEDASQADNVPLAGGLLQIAGANSQEVDTTALFGELNYSITDTVNLVAGIRYTDEEKTLQLDQQNLNSDFFLAVGTPTVAFPRDDLTFLGPQEPQVAEFENTSVRLGVNWQISEDYFTYATFSQGFKSGGFTTRLTAPFNAAFGGATNGLTRLDFDEETVDSFEIGFKGEFLNNRLRFNASAFINTYEDIQIIVLRGISPANENAGEADINGLEFELEALASDNLSIIATLGLIDAEYTEIDPLTGISPDNQLANTPESTASIALNYALQNVMGGEASFNLNYSFTDDVFNDTENTPGLFQDSTSIWNASVGWTSGNENWDLRLGVTNLSDERRLISGFASPGTGLLAGTFNRPREAYITVGYSY